MGARQSHLNIFLRTLEDSYSSDGYRVSVTREVAPESANYDVVTHNITYNKGNGTNYDIYIYNTQSTDHNASYIFAYCSPEYHKVAHKVKAYYSIIIPQAPLVISFVTEKGHTYHCNLKKLMDDRWNWAYRITEYSVELTTQLNKAFENVLWNKTIGFVEGQQITKDVIVFPRNIDKRTYRLVFIPYKEDAFLNSDCIFTFDTTPIPGTNQLVVQRGCKSGVAKNNKIDPYFLKTVYKEYYHGILVYFVKDNDNPVMLKDDHDKNTALVIEFINSTTKIHITRKDKNGTYWAKEQFQYSSYSALGTALTKLKEELKSKELNTVILDKYDSYIGVENVNTETKLSLNKYTHAFKGNNDCVFIFDRNKTEIGPIQGSGTKAKSVEVFILKVKTEKGEEKRDSKPFVIVIDIDGENKTKKGYHFDGKDEFKVWVEFKSNQKGTSTPLEGEQLIQKLYNKIEQIDKNGSCTREIQLLRELAHRILTTDDEDPLPKEVKPSQEERPAPYPPQEIPPEGPNWYLIIGSSVGAFVFVCLLALIYGIYWYNTTIKLLT